MEKKNQLQESKYYTPSIKEFYVGFEYEEFNPENQGDSSTYDKKVGTYLNLPDVFKCWKYFSEYRVKYLDHKDVESLGFKYLINKFIFPTYQLDNYYLYDCSLAVPNKFIIMRGEWRNRDIIFEGSIKNKSELKRILKQINHE